MRRAPASSPNSQLAPPPAPSLPLQLHPTLGQASCVPVSTPAPPPPPHSHPFVHISVAVHHGVGRWPWKQVGTFVQGPSPILAAETVVWAHPSSRA